MWFLCDSEDLLQQFPLGYLPMEKSEEAIIDVLKRGKFRKIVSGVPVRCRSIEDNVSSATLDDSSSTKVNHCVEWLACHVDKKDQMCDFASGSSL